MKVLSVLVLCFLLFPVITFPYSASATHNNDEEEECKYVATIKLKEGSDPNDITNEFNLGPNVLYPLTPDNDNVIIITSDTEDDDLIDEIEQHPSVEYIESDFVCIDMRIRAIIQIQEGSDVDAIADEFEDLGAEIIDTSDNTISIRAVDSVIDEIEQHPSVEQIGTLAEQNFCWERVNHRHRNGSNHAHYRFVC